MKDLPAWRRRSSRRELRSVRLPVSNMILRSNTRRREIAKPTERRARRAVGRSGIANLISVSVGCPLILLCPVSAMVIDEVLIDSLASLETLVDSMPEGDVRLSQLPAEVHFYAFEECGEVDQTHVEVLDQAAVILDFFQYVAKL